MNELQVYDVSPMVYVGYTGQKGLTYYGVPVGGIHYVLNRLAVAFTDRDSVVLCFDSPTFRKSLFEGYKSGRAKHPAVHYQLSKLYEGLQACGIKCEKYDGFEADDIMEWAVTELGSQYPYGIHLHSNDMDVGHSIRDNTTLHTLVDGMCDVNALNFDTCIQRGERIPYNTISAYKVFCGCSSDKIPAFSASNGMSSVELFRRWCEMCNEVSRVGKRSCGANPEVVRAFVKHSDLFTEAEQLELEKRIQLVFPATKPDNISIKPNTWYDVDKHKFAELCSLYNARKALQCLGMHTENLTEKDRQILREDARALETGAYSADHNLKYESRGAKSTVINLDSFTRGFSG